MLWYAPDSAYGRPDDLKALIDEAHLRGLMVFLDVVYNHFGPEGNYLGRYAPAFFTEAQTPWGSAIDYRVPQVRAFAIENALYWLRDYRFDGLRLDAVHAIAEPGEISMLHDLSRRGRRARRAKPAAHIHLVLENDDNCASLLDPATGPAARQIPRAVERRLSSRLARAADRRNARLLPRLSALAARATSRARSARALSIRARRPRIAAGNRAASRAARLPPTAFVNFLQNHDQIGNRALGDRLESIADPRGDRSRARDHAAGADDRRCCSWARNGARKHPFPFFCDFKGDLAEAVRKGRRAGIRLAPMRNIGDEVPDPLDESTFQSAVLDWDARATAGATQRLALVRELLAIRRREIVPRLAGAAFGEPQAGGQRPADGALAHGRRRNARR